MERVEHSARGAVQVQIAKPVAKRMKRQAFSLSRHYLSNRSIPIAPAKSRLFALFSSVFGLTETPGFINISE